MENKKIFVRVASTYTAKNKLGKELINELMRFDGTLFSDAQLAKKTIKTHFMVTCQGYLKAGGKAQLPDQKQWNTGDGFGFAVADANTLIGHEVKKDLTDAPGSNNPGNLCEDCHEAKASICHNCHEKQCVSMHNLGFI